MSTETVDNDERLDAQIKTRVTAAVKKGFETLAKANGRHTKPAALQREALQEYLEKHGMPNGLVEPQLALDLAKEQQP